MKCPVCKKRNAKCEYGDTLVCGHCLRKLKAYDLDDLKLTEAAYEQGIGLGTEDDRFIEEVERELFGKPRSSGAVPAITHKSK